jgi:hypothetical protein
MFEQCEARIVGRTPLILHNGRTADPTNEWSRLIAGVPKGKNMTDEQREQKSRYEFLGALYVTNGRIVIPARCWDATLKFAARTIKLGKIAEVAASCLDDSIIEYDGASDPEKLFLDKRFVLDCLCKINRARVMKTRPIFREWSTTVRFAVDTTALDKKPFVELLRIGGTKIGICDWRPKHGRFEVESVKWK